MFNKEMMTNETDIAVLKSQMDSVHESQGEQFRLLKQILEQTKKTNGRVNRMEERHEQEDREDYPRRIRLLEKLGYGAMAVCTLLVIGGASWMNASVKSIVTEALANHNSQVEANIHVMVDAAIEDALDNYEFIITK